MNGTTVTGGRGLGNIPTSWTIVGTGDFNGDGNTDLLWRDIDGDVAIWFMNGTTLVSGPDLGNIPTNWTIVGTGDFNGDGYSDILWRDTAGDVAIWYMKAQRSSPLHFSEMFPPPGRSPRPATSTPTHIATFSGGTRRATRSFG